LSVPNGIGHGFFRDPLHGDANFNRHADRGSVDQLQASLKSSPEPAHQQVERRLQSGALDDVRLQFVTQIPDVPDSAIEQTLNLGRADANVGYPVLQIHSEDIELQASAAQYLGDFIVKHAGQLSTLGLLVLQGRQSQAPEASLGLGIRVWLKPCSFEIRANTRKFQRLFPFSN
jgi:hypothetical protein